MVHLLQTLQPYQEQLQPQHKFEREVVLDRIKAAGTQESGEICGGGIGCVELGHRRNERQQATAVVRAFHRCDCREQAH